MSISSWYNELDHEEWDVNNSPMPFPFKNIIFYFGQPRYQVMKMAPPLNIYVVYTSEDTEVMLSLGQHLNQLKEFHTISIWQDDPILLGQYWLPKDDTRLGETDIFLLLVSDALMHSEFIHQLEFKMVIDRYKEDKSVVLPIIVDNCPWDIDFRSEDYNFNFNELEVLPSGGKPIAEWKLSDQIRLGLWREGGVRLRLPERQPVDHPDAEVRRREVPRGRCQAEAWPL